MKITINKESPVPLRDQLVEQIGLDIASGVLKEKEFQDKPRFMVTEAYPEGHNPVDAYMAFYAGVDPLVAAPFNFEGITLGWDPAAWRRFLTTFHEALRHQSPLCVASYAFGNHDQPRLASRLGEVKARAAAVMLLTLPGMAFIYNGEEIGMHNVDIPADMVQDPAAKNDPAKAMGRDPSRTPMQWTAGHQAGFTNGDSTWLPLAPDYQTRNVESQAQDPSSFLSLYQTLGRLRNGSDALRYGDIKVLDITTPHVLAFVREYDSQRYVTIINFGDTPAEYRSPIDLLEQVVSSLPVDAGSNQEGVVRLRPYQAVVYSA